MKKYILIVAFFITFFASAQLQIGNTDRQKITDFSISSNILSLTIENGGTKTVDLTPYLGGAGTDNQQLSFNPTTNILTLENGGTVDLSSLVDGGTGSTDLILDPASPKKVQIMVGATAAINDSITNNPTVPLGFERLVFYTDGSGSSSGGSTVSGNLWSDPVNSDIIPDGNYTRSIGSTTNNIRNIYARDIELTNAGQVQWVSNDTLGRMNASWEGDGFELKPQYRSTTANIFTAGHKFAYDKNDLRYEINSSPIITTANAVANNIAVITTAPFTVTCQDTDYVFVSQNNTYYRIGNFVHYKVYVVMQKTANTSNVQFYLSASTLPSPAVNTIDLVPIYTSNIQPGSGNMNANVTSYFMQFASNKLWYLRQSYAGNPNTDLTNIDAVASGNFIISYSGSYQTN